MSHLYDVVVIGAGSAGLTTAVGFNKVGKRVLLVEREHMGGECTNSGCIPSKALLHHAHEYHKSVGVAGPSAQSEAFRARAFEYVRHIIDGILEEETPEVFENMGIEVVKGAATFKKRNTVTVADTDYTFKKAVIATGSSPRQLELGIPTDALLTNQNLFTLTTISERLLIVGAGPIGLEMAQAFAMLGSKVTIIDTGATFAKLEDGAIQPILRTSFDALGITILLNAELKSVANGAAEVVSEGNSQTVLYDKVLVAIGRVPNLPEGLASAGVEHTKYGVVVNKNLRTSNKNVFAVGDVAERLKFTHVADDQGRQLVAHVTSKGLLKVTHKKAVPKVTYTIPEVAQVGLSQTAAAAHYGEENIMRVETSFSKNDRAKTSEQMDGVVVVIARRISGKIIGAHIAGPAAGELLAIYTLAIDQGISLWGLQRTIFAYPTYSLIIKKNADQFVGMQVSTLKADLLKKATQYLPKVIAAAAWLTALGFLMSYIASSNKTTSEITLDLFLLITTTSLAPLLYIILYTVRPLTLLPGSALTVLSGVFFGPLGILYTVIGANLSASLAYFVGRFFSTEKTNEHSLLHSWSAPLRTQPFLSILIMRLIFLPYDLVNYGAGILRVPFMPYLTATILGTLLGTATFVLVGASISIETFITEGITVNAIDVRFILLSAVIFIGSLVASKILQRKKLATS